MRREVAIGAFAVLLAYVSAQSSFSGQDQNGEPAVCVNSVCQNSNGDYCDLLTVTCDDWRCRNSPGRLM